MNTSSKNMNFLEFLPVSLFGGILGITGLSFSWRMAATTWGINAWPWKLFGIIAIVLFLVLLCAYILKWVRYPRTVKEEFRHPVSLAFFTTFIVCLLLLPGILLPSFEHLATSIWLLGVLMIIVFTLYVLRKWLGHPQEPANALPPWLLPVVGMLDVPIVGNQLHFAGVKEICLFCFGVGIILAIVFVSILLSRLIFQPPLPEALQPTLLVMVLPFAISYSDYNGFSDAPGIAGSVIYYAGIFFLLLMGGKILLLPKCCPFRVTWWAVGFPLAAITIASFRYAAHQQPGIVQVIPPVLLGILTITICYLLVQTCWRIATNTFFLMNAAAEKATRLQGAK